MDSENKEQLTLQPLSRLNLLVHPLWKTKPDHLYPAAVSRFDRERKAIAGYIANHMAPHKPDEVTVFMPLLTHHKLGTSLIQARSHIHQSPEFIQWPDLYKDMVKKASPGHNLVIGPNFVDNFEQANMSAELLLQRLKHKGYSLNSHTQIVVGGELLKACVSEAVDKLLGLQDVRRLTVDRQATLTSGYLFDSHPMLEKDNWDSFATTFRNRGYSVDVTSESVHILKPN